MNNKFSIGCMIAVLSSTACAGGMGGGQLADQWSGFYLGGNLGGIWSHFQGPITTAPFTDDVATYPASQSNAGTFIFTPMMANMALSTNQVLARLNYRF